MQEHPATEEGPKAQRDTEKIGVGVTGEVSSESCRSVSDNPRVIDTKAAVPDQPTASGLPSSYHRPSRNDTAEDAGKTIATEVHRKFFG